MTVGYLKQDVEPFSQKLLLEEVALSCEKTKAVKARIDEIVLQLEGALNETKKAALLEELGELQHRFELLGGNDVEHHAELSFAAWVFQRAIFIVL
jgi:ATP-binding cassette subfamily F protein 3